MDILEAWQKAGEHLKEGLGNTVFETWILPLKLKPKDSRTLILEAPDNFFRDWVDRHYKQTIQEAIQRIAGEEIKIILEVGIFTKDKAYPRQARPVNLRPEPQNSSHLNSRYTFENFVVGPF